MSAGGPYLRVVRKCGESDDDQITITMRANALMTDGPYYRARYYDSTVGRFISEDPIGFLGGTNFYGYVSGNPARWFDPLGLNQQDVQGVINTAQQLTNGLTSAGKRTDWFNNVIIFGQWIIGRRLPHRQLGCGEQADAVKSGLQIKYPNWKFIEQSEGMSWPWPPYPLPHQWLIGISPDPSDPPIVIDPFKNRFYPIVPVLPGVPGGSNGEDL